MPLWAGVLFILWGIGALIAAWLVVDSMRRAADTRRQPTESNVYCPHCGSGPPFAKITNLWVADIALDGLHEGQIGSRFACQKCPGTFSASHLGVFVQHPDALPWTPVREKPPGSYKMLNIRKDDDPAESGKDDRPHVSDSPFPPRDPPLTPKQKPRV